MPEVTGVLLDEVAEDPPQADRLTPAVPLRQVVDRPDRRLVPPRLRDLDPVPLEVGRGTVRRRELEVPVRRLAMAVDVRAVLAEEDVGEPVALDLGEMPDDAEQAKPGSTDRDEVVAGSARVGA